MRTLFAALVAVIVVGCGIVAPVDRSLIPGRGGAGGTPGVGGVECDVAEDCPASEEICVTASCTFGTCGVDFAAPSTPCPEGVCNGSGECVECVTEAECGPEEVCQNDGCIPVLCTNDAIDPGESDIDCGGPDCPGCDNGLSCGTHTDCASRFCDGGTCAPCTGDGDCLLTDWCDETAGTCVPKSSVGGACDEPAQCASGFCVDAVCCENACSDACESCNGAGRPGSCQPHAQGTDPEDECGGEGCSGTDACASRVCGDGIPGPMEGCDDGNTDSFDGCSALCQPPSAHLLLSEIVTTPAASAFVEIHNPLGVAVALDDVYLADFATYYLVATGGANPGNGDFIVQFPPGSTIAAGGFVVVALDGASSFSTSYGAPPDFDLRVNDAGAPDMLGSFNPNSALAAAGEILVLFRWDGSSDLVTDLDHLDYGAPEEVVDKTGVTVNASTYLADAAVQSPAAAPVSGQALHRCDTSETTEAKSGGNGSLGHDETSEAAASAWKIATVPSPGAAPPTGFCP